MDKRNCGCNKSFDNTINENSFNQIFDTFDGCFPPADNGCCCNGNEDIFFGDDFSTVNFDDGCQDPCQCGLENDPCYENNCCGNCDMYSEYIGDAKVDTDNRCQSCGYSDKNCFPQDGNCDGLFDCCDEPKPKKAHLVVEKCVNTNFALDGEILCYAIRITNQGDSNAFNVKLVDNLPCGLELIDCSLKVTGCSSCYKGNLSCLRLGAISPCDTVKIYYKVKVRCGVSGIICNCACVSYCYAEGPCSRDIKCVETKSNVVRTDIRTLPLKLILTASEGVASIGDCIVYTLKVVNESERDVDNVIVRDVLPEALKCLCIKLDGKESSCLGLASGLNIGDLPAGTHKVLTIVTKVMYFPRGGKVVNRASATYRRNGVDLCPVESDSVTTTILIYMCRKTCIDADIKVSCPNGPVHSIEDAKASAKIDCVREVDHCLEDGYKCVKVDGTLCVCIKYSTCSGCPKLIKKTVDFSLLVKVPTGFEYDKNYCIDIDPKEVCTEVRCGYNIHMSTVLLVCLTSL